MINGLNDAFGRRIQIDIELFTKKETEIISNMDFSEIQFKEDGFDRLYKYTKGIPMYINSFYNVFIC